MGGSRSIGRGRSVVIWTRSDDDPAQQCVVMQLMHQLDALILATYILAYEPHFFEGGWQPAFAAVSRFALMHSVCPGAQFKPIARDLPGGCGSVYVSI